MTTTNYCLALHRCPECGAPIIAVVDDNAMTSTRITPLCCAYRYQGERVTSWSLSVDEWRELELMACIAADDLEERGEP